MTRPHTDGHAHTNILSDVSANIIRAVDAGLIPRNVLICAMIWIFDKILYNG